MSIIFFILGGVKMINKNKNVSTDFLHFDEKTQGNIFDVLIKSHSDFNDVVGKYQFPDKTIKQFIKSKDYTRYVENLIKKQEISVEIIRDMVLWAPNYEYYTHIWDYQIVPEDILIEILETDPVTDIIQDLMDKIITTQNLSNSMILTYYSKFRMGDIFKYQTLSEKTLMSILETFDIYDNNEWFLYILTHQTVSDIFYTKYPLANDSHVESVIRRQKIGTDYIIRLMDFFPRAFTDSQVWSNMLQYQKLDPSFIDKYFHKFRVQSILDNQDLDDEFIRTHSKNFTIYQLAAANKLNGDLYLEFKDKIIEGLSHYKYN